MELKNLEKVNELSKKLDYLKDTRENLMSVNERDLLITIRNGNTASNLYNSCFKKLNKMICSMTIDAIDLQIKDIESEIRNL